MKIGETLNELELGEVARMDQTTLGQALLKLASVEAEERLREFEKAPRFNPVEGTEDIRFKMGLRRGTLRLLAWRQEAVDTVKRKNRQGDTT